MLAKLTTDLPEGAFSILPASRDGAAAEAVITLHKRASGTKDPFFLILYPRQKSGYPEQRQADDYARWFKDVQFQFDRPYAPSP